MVQLLAPKNEESCVSYLQNVRTIVFLIYDSWTFRFSLLFASFDSSCSMSFLPFFRRIRSANGTNRHNFRGRPKYARGRDLRGTASNWALAADDRQQWLVRHEFFPINAAAVKRKPETAVNRKPGHNTLGILVLSIVGSLATEACILSVLRSSPFDLTWRWSRYFFRNNTWSLLNKSTQGTQ